jgi:hypothetical protein
MMNRFFKVAALAGALVVAAGSVAMASSSAAAPGKLVPVTQEITEWFAANGVDASILTASRGSVSSAEWKKLVDLVNTPDVADDTTDVHDVLNTLVDQALINATSTYDEPVYMDIGGSRWVYELVNPDD